MSNQKTKIGYVYTIQNTVNDEVYIGSTIRDPSLRFKQHLNDSNYPRCYFHNLINLIGKEHFYITILQTIEYNDILELRVIEERFIKDYGIANTVYNIDTEKISEYRLQNKHKIVEKKALPIQKPKQSIKIIEDNFNNFTEENIIEFAKKQVDDNNYYLTINEFIDFFTSDKMKEIMEYFKSKKNIHIKKNILEFFGYMGENNDRKKSFIKLLKRNKINYQELNSTDDFSEFPSIIEELKNIDNGNKTRVKFLIMKPRDIKKAMLMLNTKKANDIREYYLALEELVQLYSVYTVEFNKRKSLKIINEKNFEINDLKK